MSFRKIVVATLVVAVLGLGGVAQAQQSKGKTSREPQKIDPAKLGETRQVTAELPKCPVSGEPISFLSATKAEDGLVYFCCDDCIAKYKADPKQYENRVQAQRTALEKLTRVQVLCPVTGEPVDKKALLEKDGKKIYFCCNDCKVKYEADPAKYQKALADAYTYQAKCPVMGNDIDPKSFTVLPNKQRVYFCCPACEAKLFAEPDKYLPKLAAQGYKIDPAEIKKAAAAKEQAVKEGKDKGAGEKEGEKEHKHDKP